jgi:transcription elongation factor Elf1
LWGSVSGVRTFFRHCPSCGRRFEIRLESKKPVDSESLTETEPEGHVSAPSLMARAVPVMLAEEATVIVDIEDFQYTYRCKHCGHEWSEVQKTERKYDAPKGYTGD